MNHPSSDFSPSLRLCCLNSGETAVVETFPSDRREFAPLQAMGFRVGELVTMLMPGHACAVAVGQTRLMVSRELLERVHVTRLD
jgi:Fe2+ transport system protein FeoA